MQSPVPLLVIATTLAALQKINTNLLGREVCGYFTGPKAGASAQPS